MKKFLIVFFILINILLFTQTKIKVTDSESQLVVPYATIIYKGVEGYKSTEENGSISINENEIISEIRAFGYENLQVKAFQNVYSLKPLYKNIKDVEILKSKNTQHFKEGKINRDFPSMRFGSTNANYYVLNYYRFKENYPAITFIKKIRFLSEVAKNKTAIINLVFFKSIDGVPSIEPFASFAVLCKKGKNNTEFDLEKSNLIFPKEGIFIGFDWIKNEENTHRYVANVINSKSQKNKEVVNSLNPSIYLQRVQKNALFMKHKFSHVDQNDFKFRDSEMRSLSIELELSN